MVSHNVYQVGRMRGLVVEPLGEFAWAVFVGDRAPGLARTARSSGVPGLEDAVPAFGTVAFYFRPGHGSPETVSSLVESMPAIDDVPPSAHTVPVCYELGDDVEVVCSLLGLSPAELVRHHAETEYLCEAVGFCPGFPYLTGLDDRLAQLPRKTTPRVRVDAGSVAIAAGMTGVYTLSRPGGWWIIGRTPLTLADPVSAYYPIAVGDRVSFTPVGLDEFHARQGERL